MTSAPVSPLRQRMIDDMRRAAGPGAQGPAAAGRAQPGRGGAAAALRAEPEAQGGAQHRLRLRPARLGDRPPEGRRHRQCADADPRRAGQGPQGPVRDALARPAGAGRHPARPRRGLPPGPRRPSEPGPAEGDVGHRGLPHRRARRPRRPLRRRPAPGGELQLVPQPPLPEMPRRGGPGLARRARGGPAAGPVLPRRLHPAGAARRRRLPEQGRGL